MPCTIWTTCRMSRIGLSCWWLCRCAWHWITVVLHKLLSSHWCSVPWSGQLEFFSDLSACFLQNFGNRIVLRRAYHKHILDSEIHAFSPGGRGWGWSRGEEKNVWGAATASAEAKKDSGGGPEDETKKLRGALEGASIQEKPNVKWRDVAGLDRAKETPKEAAILPARFPHKVMSQVYAADSRG